ncbi:acylphosphatase [Isoptericola sp. b441]|uniref:Acylphosphatase n=1 Tax=Actinotalea lenta TaxID=3064654 RepID=A0ABT9D7U5_9CELL|nr:acylphosphatase [Isoptericola sp. b441]MDO8106942.1 acylphosphatase [Isoptericola sp. b441]
MIARHVVVHGMVQGVGFRWSMASEARRAGARGWVRNRSDGTVEAHVEGDQEAVDALVTWAHGGPRLARVTHVEVDDAQPTGAVEFDIEP